MIQANLARRKKKHSLVAWNALEDSSDEKLPKCLKHLLISSGYDKLSSLGQIDEKSIKEIEQFHTTTKCYVNQLNCCYSEYYKQLESFAFLPGHKVTLLGIPTRIAQIKPEIKQKKPKKQASAASKKTVSNEDLISNLINNLMQYSGKAGFQFPDGTITDLNIQDFIRGTNEDNFVCKCKFSCPFCTKIVPLQYKQFWMTSNVTQHIKMHNNAK